MQSKDPVNNFLTNLLATSTSQTSLPASFVKHLSPMLKQKLPSAMIVTSDSLHGQMANQPVSIDQFSLYGSSHYNFNIYYCDFKQMKSKMSKNNVVSQHKVVKVTLDCSNNMCVVQFPINILVSL